MLRQHADVLFDMDSAGHLVRLNEDSDEPPPRLFLARGGISHEAWFRTDVSEETAQACREIAADLPPWVGGEPPRALYDRLRVALTRDTDITAESAGPAFRFGPRVELPTDVEVRLIDAGSAHLLERFFPYTRSVLASRRPVVGVVVDGAVVSACYSARSRPTAAEAGVDTEEPHRRKGLGALVVSRWRDALEAEGRAQLYSTTWDNHASLAVARRLGLIAYADTLSIT